MEVVLMTKVLITYADNEFQVDRIFERKNKEGIMVLHFEKLGTLGHVSNDYLGINDSMHLHNSEWGPTATIKLNKGAVICSNGHLTYRGNAVICK